MRRIKGPGFMSISTGEPGSHPGNDTIGNAGIAQVPMNPEGSQPHYVHGSLSKPPRVSGKSGCKRRVYGYGRSCGMFNILRWRIDLRKVPFQHDVHLPLEVIDIASAAHGQ